MRISRPVFIVGMPRSGTTVFYQALAVHEDLAWFPNYSNVFPRLGLPAAILPRIYTWAWCRRLLQTSRRKHSKGLGYLRRFLPTPDEIYPLWQRWCGQKFRRQYLIGLTATPDECRTVHKAVRWVLRLQSKPRFVTKITGPPRIGYLRSIFPDVVFVHIIRDGRAVVNSLLNVDFWKDSGGYGRPWWTGGLPAGWKEEWKCFGQSAMALSAIQWRAVLQVARQEREQLAPHQYFEIKYEDFVADPPKVMDGVLARCGLRRSPRVSEYVSQSSRFRDFNYKYLERFSREEIHMLERIMGDWLDHYGYARSAPTC